MSNTTFYKVCCTWFDKKNGDLKEKTIGMYMDEGLATMARDKVVSYIDRVDRKPYNLTYRVWIIPFKVSYDIDNITDDFLSDLFYGTCFLMKGS